MQPGDCLATMYPFHEIALDYYLRTPARCLLPEPSAEAARAVPASSSIFLLATQVKEHERDAAVDALASVRPLVFFHTFRAGDLYAFGPAVTVNVD